MQPPFNYLTYRIPKFVSRNMLRRLVNRIYLASKLMLKPFTLVARRLQIEELHSTLDMFMGDLTLVTETPEILGITKEDLESWTPSRQELFHSKPQLRYVGPMYALLFGDIPEEVEQFLDTDDPTIYVALTSTRPNYLRSTVAALASLDARVLVVTTVHELDGFPANVMMCRHLPSHRVMPKVDLAVIHGGQGSVQTAVASGTPAIIFPLQTEQMFNAQLIENHGAGINLPLQDMDKPERVKDAAESIFQNASFKTSAEQLKALQASYDGPRNAARILMDEAERRVGP